MTNETATTTYPESGTLAHTAIVNQARVIFASDGELEVDGDAHITVEGALAHVECWVWVRAGEAGIVEDMDEADQVEAYRSAAVDDDAQVHDDARVSLGDDEGAYVQGWVVFGLSDSSWLALQGDDTQAQNSGQRTGKSRYTTITCHQTDSESIAITTNLSDHVGGVTVAADDAMESLLLALAAEGVELDVLAEATDKALESVAQRGDSTPPPEDPDAINALIEANGGSVWDTHPDHPRDVWQYEVANEDTVLGYWPWVLHRVEAECDEPQQAATDYEFVVQIEGMNRNAAMIELPAAIASITPELEQRITEARQALKRLGYARSITIAAPDSVTWPVDSIRRAGLAVIEADQDFNDFTRIEIGPERIAFFTDSPFGSEGTALTTEPRPVTWGE